MSLLSCTQCTEFLFLKYMSCSPHLRLGELQVSGLYIYRRNIVFASSSDINYSSSLQRYKNQQGDELAVLGNVKAMQWKRDVDVQRVTRKKESERKRRICWLASSFMDFL